MTVGNAWTGQKGLKIEPREGMVQGSGESRGASVVEPGMGPPWRVGDSLQAHRLETEIPRTRDCAR